MDARSRECVESVRATDFLLGQDEWGARWIAAHRACQAAKREAAAAQAELAPPRPRRARAQPGRWLQATPSTAGQAPTAPNGVRV